MSAGFLEFEFDLPEALLERLVKAFSGMISVSLSRETAMSIPNSQGVYQLFLDEELCYIGKTDAEAGLRTRLLRHAEKIQHRHGLDPERIRFRAVRIFVFTAVDLETQLIKHYKLKTWNGSGFGSNDPGRNRDTSHYRPEHFDAIYPIDIDYKLTELSLPPSASASDYFRLIRQKIPYTFRAESDEKNSRKPHSDFLNIVTLSDSTKPTVRSMLTTVVNQLPAGWQLVKLPSHIILYKDNKHYPSGEILARS